MSTPGTWMKIPNVLAAELGTRDFASVVEYAAKCIRVAARHVQADDASDLHAKQGNMRDHAKRLDSLAKSLYRYEKRRKTRLVKRV